MRRPFPIAVSLIITAVVFFLLGRSLVPVTSEAILDTRIAEKVWSIIQSSYLRASSIDNESIKYGLAKGVMNSLKDQHSAFFDPKEAREFLASLKGDLEGIGAELRLRDGVVYVVTPLPNSPAEKAGILPGDAILKINGENLGSVADLTSVVSRIRGPKGTSITLSILHKNEVESVEITIVRDRIHQESIEFEERMVKGNNVGIIRMSQFSEDVSDELRKAMRAVQEKNISKLVLDLRFNGGGYLDQALEVLSFFVSENLPAVVMEGKSSNQVKETFSTGLRYDGSLVVLVNEASASASEIVAGALQDHGRAKVIGTKTYGKGSVQEVKNLSDGSALRITIAEWKTPRGRSIENVGITPDVEVKLQYEKYREGDDNQLEKAFDFL